MGHIRKSTLIRRDLLKTAGKATAVVVASPLVELALGGVNVIKGTFASGAPMTAIPNPMRYNRHSPAAQPSPGPPPAPGTPRPEPPPPESSVWIREK